MSKAKQHPKREPVIAVICPMTGQLYDGATIDSDRYCPIVAGRLPCCPLGVPRPRLIRAGDVLPLEESAVSTTPG